MAPSGEAYHTDWIISTSSNVSVANNRDWFTTFTPFETYCDQLHGGLGLEVAGIGTVPLNLKLRKYKPAGKTNSRNITLQNVLYVPSSVCNIFSLRRSLISGFKLEISQSGAILIDGVGNRIGLVDMSNMLRLCLHGQRRCPSLYSDTMYNTSAMWPETERARWDAHQAEQKNISMTPYNGDVPYSTDEKAWLKKNYDGEFNFLRSLGLSIYKDEDRTEGRLIMRSWMTEDGDKPKGNGPQNPIVVMGMTGFVHMSRRNDNYEDEDEDEDNIEKYSDDFLQELEDDPMSHLADYNFSSAELEWIQKHYQHSSNFMLSYGLKPFEQEDCDEAKAIVRAIIEDD